MFQAYFEDKEKGGLFHAVKKDWSGVVDTDKHAKNSLMLPASVLSAP